ASETGMSDVHATTARRSASWHSSFFQDSVPLELTQGRDSIAATGGSILTHANGRRGFGCCHVNGWLCPISYRCSPQLLRYQQAPPRSGLSRQRFRPLAQSVIRPDHHWHAWNRRYSGHGLRRLAPVDEDSP